MPFYVLLKDIFKYFHVHRKMKENIHDKKHKRRNVQVAPRVLSIQIPIILRYVIIKTFCRIVKTIYNNFLWFCARSLILSSSHFLFNISCSRTKQVVDSEIK